jgi:hypothetical protein
MKCGRKTTEGSLKAVIKHNCRHGFGSSLRVNGFSVKLRAIGWSKIINGSLIRRYQYGTKMFYLGSSSN